MMKKLYSLTTLAGILLTVLLGFSSCEADPDDNIGYDLQGHWFGDLDMWYDGIPARGSDIIFYPEGWGYRQGTGTQIDYYGRYGFSQIRHDFSYRITYGVIYLTFYDEPDLDCTIRDYGLDSYNFWGRIDGRYSSTDFRLRNYDRDWDRYGYSNYDYDYDRRWYGDYYSEYYDTHRSTRAEGTIGFEDGDTLQSASPKGIRGCNRPTSSRSQDQS